MKTLTLIVSLFIISSIGSMTSPSHSGGTDANGCHMNHKTGVYHCH